MYPSGNQHEIRKFVKPKKDCPQCSEQFLNKSLLLEHIKKVHGGGEKPFMCKEKFCKAAFFSESKLKKHSLSCPKRNKLNENGNEKCEHQSRKRKFIDQPWTNVNVENRNVRKIKLRRVGLTETVVSPTASSRSGVDMALQFFLTPVIALHVREWHVRREWLSNVLNNGLKLLISFKLCSKTNIFSDIGNKTIFVKEKIALMYVHSDLSYLQRDQDSNKNVLGEELHIVLL